MSNVQPLSRRNALARLAALVLVPVVLPRRLHAQPRVAHPTPRKGITGDKVLTAAQLASAPHLVELFDGVRNIPQVVDGIRCHCGCADMDGHYSLLSCYESEAAMAKICPICQGEGRVAVRLAKAGKSLDEIRAAIDAQFG
jgi:hypothetical protein